MKYNSQNRTNIPTIEEMKEKYKIDLRIDAIEKNNLENINAQNGEGAFFNKFRRSNIEENLIKNDFKENTYYKKYKEYVNKELKTKEEQILNLENLIEYEKFFLKWERKVNYKSNNYNGYGSTSSTRYHVDYIEKLEEELDNILKNSEEAWQFYYKRQLLDDIEKQQKHKLVDVEYVLNAKKKVAESLNQGVPVYIVGHLGSGKTQLATEAAISFTVQNKIQSELEIQMEEWFLENQNADEKMAIEKFRELNAQRKNHYKNILEEGSGEEIEKLQPLFISGSHNITYEDMFIEKTLTLGHSFSKGSFSDYLDLIIDDFYIWMNEHKEKLDKMTEEEQLNLKIQIWKSFSDLLVAKNSAFGTEIKKVEKEILIAVTEGRTVIIDELNTIAMQNLIALNDILQRKAGSRAYITGVGPVLIKEGFGLIGTGNLSTQRVNYEGTNELNPAFKSRFMTIEYNYVNQNLIGALSEQENPEENELFRIIISRLTDKYGNIHLPGGIDTLEELFRFAKLCKVTQDVFMGKLKESGLDENSQVEDLELREAVLSIRNILNVLDNWNLGEEKDLSKALWDSFISTITYADDQNYILSQSVRFGFFKKSDGWNIVTKSEGDSTTTYEEIREYPYKYIRKNIETFSYFDLIKLLFGNEPKNTEISEELKQILKDNIEENLKINIDKYQELDEKLSHLEHSIDLLEYLEDFGEN